MIEHLVTFASLAGALVAGGLVLVSLGIVRGVRTFDERSWPELHRALNTTIGPYLSRVLAIAILSLTALALSAPGHVHLAIAAALFAGVLAISLLVNVPINRAVARWTLVPADWQHTRARWNRFQHVRATLAVAGLVLVLAGGAPV